MGSTAEWDQIVSFFSGKFYCIAVDLPGHGRTEIHNQVDYRMENCAANLIAFLDEMNIFTCRLVSYSMGGRLAFYLAIHYPIKFDKIVVESASPGLKSEKERRDRIKHDRTLAYQLETQPLKQFLHSWYDQPIFASLDKESRQYNELIQKRIQNDPKRLSLSLKLMGAGVQPPLWGLLDRISADVLLIVGAKDNKYKQIATAVAAGCPKVQVKIVENAGHNVHLENEPEYVKQVNLFLNNSKND
jgi:2-succinyl-6-hydroxy-2,4-cyclohexadiene-1-carboxylate synthase